MVNVFGSFGGIVSAVGRLVFGPSDEVQEAKNGNADFEDEVPQEREGGQIPQEDENNIWDAVNRNQPRGSSPMSSAGNVEHDLACAENSDHGVSSKSPAGERSCSLSSSSSHPPGTCGGPSCRSRRRRSSICGKRKRQALAVGLQSEFGCPLCFELLATPFDGFGCGHMLCGQCLLDMVEHSAAARAHADQFDLLDSEEAFLRHLRLPSCPSCRRALSSLPSAAIPMVKNAIQLVATNSLSADDKKEYDERVAGETESHFRDRFAEMLQPKLDALSEFKKRKKRHVFAQLRQQREEAARRLQQAEAQELLRRQEEALRQQREEAVRRQQREEAAIRLQQAEVQEELQRRLRQQQEEAVRRQRQEEAARQQQREEEARRQQQEALRLRQDVEQAQARWQPQEAVRRHQDPVDHPVARDRDLDRRVAEVIDELENLPRRVSLAPDHRGGGDNGDEIVDAREIENFLDMDNQGFVEYADRAIGADFAREAVNERREPYEANAPEAPDVNRAARVLFAELDSRTPAFEYDKYGRAKCRLCHEKIDRDCLRVKLARPQGFWHAGCAVREHSHYFHVRAERMRGYDNISAADLNDLIL